MSTKLRSKVSCDCKECNGKYVDERTRKGHFELERHLASSVSGFVPFLPRNNRDKPAQTVLEVYHSKIAEGSSESKEKAGQEESTSFNNNYESDLAGFVPQKKRSHDKPEVNQESNKPIDGYEYAGFVAQKRRKQDQF
jgi:hypothetical protein